MDVFHTELANIASLVRQGFLVRVETQVNDMRDAERLNGAQLLFGRLTRSREASVDPTPHKNLREIVDRQVCSHEHSSSFEGCPGERHSDSCSPVVLHLTRQLHEPSLYRRK